MGLHSLRGYFRQLPAMNLEQMASVIKQEQILK